MRIYEHVFIKAGDIRGLSRAYNGCNDLNKHGFRCPPDGLSKDMNLLLVSRSVTEEASAALYSKNTFWLYHTANEKILEWLVRIGQRNRQLLRSLRIDFAYGVEHASFFGSVQDLMITTLAVDASLNPFYHGICELLERFELQTVESITSTLACLSQGQNLNSFQLRLPGRNGGRLSDELLDKDIAGFFFLREVFERHKKVRDALLLLGHVRCLSVGPVTDIGELEAIGRHLKVDELYTLRSSLQYE